MLKVWKTIATQTVYENPWWTYRLDRFEIPGGIAGDYHYVYTLGSSMVVALTDARQLVLVNQYRYLCQRESLEFPCGSIKPGHSALDTAHLELAEEAGFSAHTMTLSGQFTPYNGVASETCYVYLAKQLAPATAQADPTEELELYLLDPMTFDGMVSDGAIWDGMTLAAWMLVRRQVLAEAGSDRK